MIFYSDKKRLKLLVKSGIDEIEIAKNELKMRQSELRRVAENCIRQFKVFVTDNKDLYDSGFIDIMYSKKEVISVKIDNDKDAIVIETRCFIGSLLGKEKTCFILIPMLFIEDPDQYRSKRIMQLKFKDKTLEEVNNHYDGEVKKLLEEVAKLQKEKGLINGQIDTDDLWEL